MSIIEDIENFFTVLKESNYDFGLAYSQNPNNAQFFIFVVLFLGVAFIAISAIKKFQFSKLILELKNCSDFLDFDRKLSKISNNIAKRGTQNAKKLEASKDEIYELALKLIKDFDLEKKIDAYEKISQNFSLIAANSKKYEIENLDKFFEKKSKTLLENNLFDEINIYAKSVRFNEFEIKTINRIVEYSKKLPNPYGILNLLQEEINKFSFVFNLEIFKFVEKLDENAGEIFVVSSKKMDSFWKDKNKDISENILNYVLQNGEKQRVYDYISNLKNEKYLQKLYFRFFDKIDDLELNLAFIKNDVKIDANYKEYVNSQITYNWKNLEYINHILNAPKVLQTIGHDDYRKILERIEKLEKEINFEKKMEEIFELAQNAQKIAKEAKAIARSK